MPKPKEPTRCGWVTAEPIYLDYHDREWGVPLRDDRLLFEALVLDGAQAGLSWLTILKKRENYRRAFAAFDPQRVARFGDADITRLLGDAGIVRNRLKIESAITNARATLALLDDGVRLSEFLWQFTGGKPQQNRRKDLGEIPAETPESQAMSRALKQRGFRFVGPTICYAMMQATGMVNDHTTDCFRHAPCGRLG